MMPYGPTSSSHDALILYNLLTFTNRFCRRRRTLARLMLTPIDMKTVPEFTIQRTFVHMAVGVLTATNILACVRNNCSPFVITGPKKFQVGAKT
jgi:hypothetical protein